MPDGSENPFLASEASNGLRVGLPVLAPFQSQLYVSMTPLKRAPLAPIYVFGYCQIRACHIAENLLDAMQQPDHNSGILHF